MNGARDARAGMIQAMEVAESLDRVGAALLKVLDYLARPAVARDLKLTPPTEEK